MKLPTITTFAALVDLVVSSPDTLFIRYSAGPAADKRMGWRSTNHQTGQREDGLSVNALHDIKHGIHARDDRRYIAQQTAEYRFIGSRAWIMRGDVCGEGSDRELTICNVAPIAWIAETVIDEARAYLNTHDPATIRVNARFGGAVGPTICTCPDCHDARQAARPGKP